MKSIIILFFLTLTCGTASAQFGVCNRAAQDAINLVNFKTNQKTQLVLRHNYPPHVIQAHLDIINYSHQDAINSVYQNHNACEQGFVHPQQIVDSAMFVFTMGLNRALPPGMARIDISEIMDGRPLGGPNAIIPQTRERILGGDRGTISNVIRDPIRCLTFQRDC